MQTGTRCGSCKEEQNMSWQGIVGLIIGITAITIFYFKGKR